MRFIWVINTKTIDILKIRLCLFIAFGVEICLI